MIGRLRHVFESLRQRKGEWTLFAVLQRTWRQGSDWDLVLSAPWLPAATRMQNRGLISDTLREVSTPHEMTELNIVLLLTDPADVAAAAGSLLNGRAIAHPIGLVRRKRFDFRGQTLRRGYVWAANLPTVAADAPAGPAA